MPRAARHLERVPMIEPVWDLLVFEAGALLFMLVVFGQIALRADHLASAVRVPSNPVARKILHEQDNWMQVSACNTQTLFQSVARLGCLQACRYIRERLVERLIAP